MTYSEDDIVLISAIEHYAYCPRQYALIHLEQVFEENVFTLQGSAQHKRADEPETTTTEEGKRVVRALPLCSERYGLQGKADVIEFYEDGRIVPIEYKHGPRQVRVHDDLQLCAQAVCLEEMCGQEVKRGMIFSRASQHSREVEFTPELRATMLAVVEKIRECLRRGETPPPVNDQRCPNCSLINACQPALLARARRHPGEALLSPAHWRRDGGEAG